MSQWIINERRTAIYLRDGLTCVWCLADLHHVEPEDITLDHIIPRSKGGNNSSFNLVTACRRCNSSRQDRDHKVFALVVFVVAGAIQRINSQRRKKINLSLAKSFRAGRSNKARS